MSICPRSTGPIECDKRSPRIAAGSARICFHLAAGPPACGFESGEPFVEAGTEGFGDGTVGLAGVDEGGALGLPESDDGVCPMLKRATGHCMIYADRPFGCRTHFCRAAGGPYDRRDVIDLIRRLEAVDARLGGDGPHPLPAAVQSVLDSA